MFGMELAKWVLILLIIWWCLAQANFPSGEWFGPRQSELQRRAVTSAMKIEVSPNKGEIPGEQPKPASAQSSDRDDTAVALWRRSSGMPKLEEGAWPRNETANWSSWDGSCPSEHPDGAVRR